MADVVFNTALGAARRFGNTDPNAWQMLLLKAAEADDALRDHATVAALLAAAGNTEADATNYDRITGIAASVAQDDVNNDVSLDIPDQTFTALGGTTNNSLVKAIIAVQTGADDTTLIPITAHDITVTTDGSDLTIQIPAGGFYTAA